jgi:hypothetical protein
MSNHEVVRAEQVRVRKLWLAKHPEHAAAKKEDAKRRLTETQKWNA